MSDEKVFSEAAEEIQAMQGKEQNFKTGDRVAHVLCVAHMQGEVKGVNPARKAFVLWDSMKDLKKIVRVAFCDLVKIGKTGEEI